MIMLFSLPYLRPSRTLYYLHRLMLIHLLTGYLLTFDALTMEFHKVKLPKDTHDCAVCGDHPTILEPIDYEQEVCEETAGRFATRDEQ